VTPEDLAIPALVERLQHHPVEEVIVATNATVEGEATAHYLAEALRPLGVRVTRLAQGVPLGGELELVDGGTLGRAFAGRTAL
jgi:recombination protein RecR